MSWTVKEVGISGAKVRGLEEPISEVVRMSFVNGLLVGAR